MADQSLNKTKDSFISAYSRDQTLKDIDDLTGMMEELKRQVIFKEEQIRIITKKKNKINSPMLQVQKHSDTDQINSFNPAVYIRAPLKDNFWEKIIDNNRHLPWKKDKITRIEDTKNQARTVSKEQYETINSLITQLEDLKGYKASYEELINIDEELDKEINQANLEIESMHAQNQFDIREYNLMKQTIISNEKNFQRVKNYYSKSRDEYIIERDKLSERLQKLTTHQSNKKGLLRISEQFSTAQLFTSVKTEKNLDKIFNRFKSVARDSKKFNDLLTLITEFISLIDFEIDQLNGQKYISHLENNERKQIFHLRTLLLQDDMFKFYIDGLLSNEIGNYYKTLGFLVQLGENHILDKIRLFETREIITKVINTLMSDENIQERKLIFNFFNILIKYSQKYIDSFVAFGGIQYIIGEMIKTPDPIYINSNHYFQFVFLLQNLLCESQHIFGKEYLQDPFLLLLISLLEECNNSDTILCILKILSVICKDKSVRKRYLKLMVFPKLQNFYIVTFQTNKTEIMFQLLVVLSSFMSSFSFRCQFSSLLDINNDFRAFFSPFDAENQEISNNYIKQATLNILKYTVLINQSYENENRIIMGNSNCLKSMLKNCLDSDSEILKEKSLDILISLHDLIIQGYILIDDLIADFDKIFNFELDDQLLFKKLDKVYLFVSWGILTNNLGFNSITRNFVKKVIDTGFDALLKGSPQLFQKSHFIIFLILEHENWEEIVTSMMYYERYITSRVGANRECKKIWLNGFILLLKVDSFKKLLQSSNKLITFFQNEVKVEIENFNSIVMMILYESMKWPEFFESFNEDYFIQQIIKGFLGSIDEYSGYTQKLEWALKVILFISEQKQTSYYLSQNSIFIDFTILLLQKHDKEEYQRINCILLMILYNLFKTTTVESLEIIFNNQMLGAIEHVIQFNKHPCGDHYLYRILLYIEDVGLLEKGAATGKIVNSDVDKLEEEQIDVQTYILNFEISNMMKLFMNKFEEDCHLD